MVQIPVSIPSFPVLVDDQDDVLAADQNTPNDEIEALATLAGMLGLSQSYSLDFLDAFMNSIPTVEASYSSASAISMSAGFVACKNAAGSQRVLRYNSGTTSIGAADLDSGVAFANSTQYYIYASADAAATTLAFKISTNSSTPTGVTRYKKIAKFMTDASGNILQNTVLNERYNYKPVNTTLEMVFGSYTGDGLDNRDITIGFSDTTKIPKFVLELGTTGGHWMFYGQANGYAPSDGSSQINGIKSFGANKFVVGTNAEANQNGTTKYFLAIG